MPTCSLFRDWSSSSLFFPLSNYRMMGEVMSSIKGQVRVSCLRFDIIYASVMEINTELLACFSGPYHT